MNTELYYTTISNKTDDEVCRVLERDPNPIIRNLVARINSIDHKEVAEADAYERMAAFKDMLCTKLTIMNEDMLTKLIKSVVSKIFGIEKNHALDLALKTFIEGLNEDIESTIESEFSFYVDQVSP